MSTGATAFGAAGSLVVILIWIYYSSQILFFGAEFTQVYAYRSGSKVQPAPNAGHSCGLICPCKTSPLRHSAGSST